MNWARTAILATVMGGTGVASAQLGVGPLSSVRGGVFFGTNGGSRTGWAVGADTKFVGLKLPFLGVGASLEGSVDYYQVGSNHNIPVLLGARFTQGMTSFGIGAGVGFSHVSSGESVDFNMAFSVRQSLSKGPLPLFLEGRYYYSSRNAVSGIALMLGLRF